MQSFLKQQIYIYLEQSKTMAGRLDELSCDNVMRSERPVLQEM